MTPDELIVDFETAFAGRRKFVGGLLPAFVDFLDDCGMLGEGYGSFDEALEDFPQELKTASGGDANTLIVRLDDKSTRSIRPYYNRIENLFVAEHQRFDYPKCAPHATQAWSDYEYWLDALVVMDRSDAIRVRESAIQHVLDVLPTCEVDFSELTDAPRYYSRLLMDFDFSAQRGERTGSAWQGAVFAFMRADSPHLQLEVASVRTGGKRVGIIGDISGWQGNRLIVAVEAKHVILSVDDVDESEYQRFRADVTQRKALGIVAATAFGAGAREAFEEQGLRCLDREDLIIRADLWDSLKQRAAMDAFQYYVEQKDKKSALTERVRTFVAELAVE